MRLEVNGGKTDYDGVYAVTKYSTLSVSKSKVSPIMNNFPIIIDITKGGVIDRAGSFVWWMADLTSPTVFKKASWWSLEDWVYEKYKPYWDKFSKFYPRFRQQALYDESRSNPSFLDFLQLIWLDLISGRYVLQAEVVKDFRSRLETSLMINLGINYEDLHPVVEQGSSVSSDDLSDLASALGMPVDVDNSTGEVVSQ